MPTTRHTSFLLASAPVLHSETALPLWSPADSTEPLVPVSVPVPGRSDGLIPKMNRMISRMMPPRPPPMTMPPGPRPPPPPDSTCEVSSWTSSLKLIEPPVRVGMASGSLWLS